MLRGGLHNLSSIGAHRVEMYEQMRAYAEEAKRNGLAVLVWSYPRGSGLSKDGESAIDAAAISRIRMAP